MAKKDKKEQGWDWSWRTSRGQSWVPGVALILIGVVFLARSYAGFELTNWWALFILFPAVGNFVRAVESYQEAGRLKRSARTNLFWGLFFTLLSASFLFSLDFGLIWPAFLIIGGLAMLLGAF